MNKRIIVTFIVTFLLFSCGTIYAMRVVKPPYFTDLTQSDQRSQLNKFIEDIWLMQGGRLELDIVSTTKTNANNGEVWIIMTGNTGRIQYKANGHIFTITPDGF